MNSHQKKKAKTLKIRKKCQRKILTWAKSKNEIGFLCAGKKKKITHVFKVRNKSKFPLHRFQWDRSQKKKIEKKIKQRGCRLLAEGHSHPNKRHLRYPSLEDLRYFKKKHPHFIALSNLNKLKCWMLKVNSRATRKNEIQVELI